MKSLLSMPLEFRVLTWHSGPSHGLGGSHLLQSMSFQYGLKKVPGTIDCLSDEFVLGLWRVLLDFYSALWEEWLRVPVSWCSGSKSNRKEIVVTGSGLRASFSAPRSCIIRSMKAAWYKRPPAEFYSGCDASRLTFISLVFRVLSIG